MTARQEPYDLNAQIRAVAREVRLRESVYPGWINRGRMTADQAAREISAMRAVLTTLERLRAQSQQSDLFSPTHAKESP